MVERGFCVVERGFCVVEPGFRVVELGFCVVELGFCGVRGVFRGVRGAPHHIECTKIIIYIQVSRVIVAVIIFPSIVVF